MFLLHQPGRYFIVLQHQLATLTRHVKTLYPLSLHVELNRIEITSTYIRNDQKNRRRLTAAIEPHL